MGQGPAGDVGGHPLKNRLLYILGEVLQFKPSVSPCKVSLKLNVNIIFRSLRDERGEEGRLRGALHILQQFPPSAYIWYHLSFAGGLVCPLARASTLYLTFWPSCLLLFKLPERFQHQHTPVSGARQRAHTGDEKQTLQHFSGQNCSF